MRRRKPEFPASRPDVDYNLWPLFNRAWVFQERILSPRLIYLAKEQLYWECATWFISEDGRESKKTSYHGGVLKNSNADPKTAWLAAVAEYSKLKLTYESDRLPAISARQKDRDPVGGHDLVDGTRSGAASTKHKIPYLVLGFCAIWRHPKLGTCTSFGTTDRRQLRDQRPFSHWSYIQCLCRGQGTFS